MHRILESNGERTHVSKHSAALHPKSTTDFGLGAHLLYHATCDESYHEARARLCRHLELKSCYRDTIVNGAHGRFHSHWPQNEDRFPICIVYPARITKRAEGNTKDKHNGS